MRNIGIGIIGGGYMGKAHAVAYHAVGAVFATNLRPVCELVCTTTETGARETAKKLGFLRSTADWRILVADPLVEAVIIACPQQFHRDIAVAAFKAGKPVFCEKPLGSSLADGVAMVAAAEASGLANMTGFNYIRTPASQLAREIINSGEIGEITSFRGEHLEDFYANPSEPVSWRTDGRANGAMGDLAPHMINGALALAGPIVSVVSDIQTIHKTRPTNDSTARDGMAKVTNDDQGQLLCRFENGASGSIFISRVATGRKMGYTYQIYGTKGAICFDQEDQNALWLYDSGVKSNRQGFTKILTGPEHPDYKAFCQGAGHGTGYQDQIIIEAKDFLTAIETGKPVWPTFRDGLEVTKVIDAAWLSDEQKKWVAVN
ncbi:MAG: Gfo/Idh/MocA family oxidoreductase [Rhizobiales bacterium]|nr:Gfo/Idh/MocA family oxidoreductase [Hyphomicrobiales bacterium]NRB13195.1 Gfo/Idh/MocA family oxidoreductase [Hyphomicrobiales bacterium]